jgi:C4-dicarboxylate-specific signal transduction histidine kinase
LGARLENLFSNLAPNWRDPQAEKPTLHLRNMAATATTSAMAEVEFFSPWPPAVEQVAPEKLFEPFASGRPGGLGLGLYQARKSLREAGGELRAEPSAEGLSFLLLIPSQAP